MTNTPDSATADKREPEAIKAVPLPRPGRWIAATLILVIAFLFLWGVFTNPSYRWDTYAAYMFDTRIAKAAWYTLVLTVLSMLLAIIVGVTVAVMRMSDNPILRYVAWFYLWIFRGTPVYLQLTLWGLFTAIYSSINLGIPWGPTFVHLTTEQLNNVFWLAVIGLGLNESAYMAEIVRAGINSVPEGQSEASTALGMSRAQTLRRTVLPQAMRVIIPPTGNEVIGMLKTTSLVSAVPFVGELFGQAKDISALNFQPIPLLLVAATWYLIITSVLMVAQYYLETYYSRGATRKLTAKQLRDLSDAEGVPPSNIEIVPERTREDDR